jgi:hypothetical protein
MPESRSIRKSVLFKLRLARQLYCRYMARRNANKAAKVHAFRMKSLTPSDKKALATIDGFSNHKRNLWLRAKREPTMENVKAFLKLFKETKSAQQSRGRHSTLVVHDDLIGNVAT